MKMRTLTAAHDSRRAAFKVRIIWLGNGREARVDRFFAQCDPEKDNLCLYGYPDGNWQVELPAEEVPAELPEPALGINFARDGMQRKDWLALVSVHSDSWLLSVAFFQGARLNKEQRQELFSLINSLPTIYEVVAGRSAAAAAQQPNKKRPSSSTAARPAQRQRLDAEYDDEEEEDDDDGWQDGEGDPCPGCARTYKEGDFWIACDACDVWWCGRCAKMSANKAKQVHKWRCNKCSGIA